ncbi:MAG: hypothetical protein LC800_07710 [Acidobacteria bacterium]|nr:hypothetical protein [Acidobacteriota bacterium]
MNQPHSQTPPRLRAHASARPATLAALCLLLALAGCRRGQPPADSGASNANAAASSTPAAATLCGAPYYPVRAGLEKQYRVTYATRGLPPAVYTETHADIAPDSFKLRYSFPDLTVDTGWNCTPEGMVALEYGKLDFAREQNTKFKLETVGRTGVTVPSAERWRVGATWASRYDIKSTISTGQQGEPPGEGAGTIEIANKIVGEEEVTVAAGKFRALKVESVFQMQMTVRVGKVRMPTSTDMKNISWFAEGVGMIRAESTGDFAGATTELVSLKR